MSGCCVSCWCRQHRPDGRRPLCSTTALWGKLSYSAGCLCTCSARGCTSVLVHHSIHSFTSHASLMNNRCTSAVHAVLDTCPARKAAAPHAAAGPAGASVYGMQPALARLQVPGCNICKQGCFAIICAAVGAQLPTSGPLLLHALPCCASLRQSGLAQRPSPSWLACLLGWLTRAASAMVPGGTGAVCSTECATVPGSLAQW